ncbi:hypothetical protein [Hyalangium versicolor]|uniref:hypothetical protein n=1 Tax=Hyalangium versicolor TaxID=2861190 RepID=UPI001CCCE7D1|nr:hypothetical protein [Hyalangium versicolor]
MFQLFQTKSKDMSNSVRQALSQDMTLEQVRVALIQLMGEESRNHYRMGELYNYVVDKKLAELAGFKDARDYFLQNLKDLSQTTLSSYGTVARKFSEEVAWRYGVTCLTLLLTYKEMAGLKVDHEAPGEALIEVPDAKGVLTAKPFSACSVEEMRQAIRAKRKPTSSKPLTAEDVALADQVGKAVVSRFQKGDPVKVQLRNHQGEAVLDIQGIPLSKLAQLVEALTADGGAALKAPQ